MLVGITLAVLWADRWRGPIVAALVTIRVYPFIDYLMPREPRLLSRPLWTERVGRRIP